MNHYFTFETKQTDKMQNIEKNAIEIRSRYQNRASLSIISYIIHCTNVNCNQSWNRVTGICCRVCN